MWSGGVVNIVKALVVALVGLILAGPVISTAGTAGGAPGIASFVGTKALNDLIPTLYYLGLMASVLTVSGIGGAAVKYVKRNKQSSN